LGEIVCDTNDLVSASLAKTHGICPIRI
jgi:hypothetical protein